MIKNLLLIVLSLFWLWYAVGFVFIGGMIDVVLGVFQGEGRQLLCGTNGCSDKVYLLSFIWLFGQILIIVGLPVLIVYLFLKNRRK